MSKPKKEKKGRTVKYSIIASLILSIVFIIIILYITVKPSDINLLSKVNIQYEFFIAAIVLNFVSWCIWGARLKILADSLEDHVSVGWWQSTQIIMANLFLAAITPSMAGGEPVRVHLLRKDGLSYGCALATVLGERLIDAIFLLTCVPFALYILRRSIVNESVQIGLTIGIGFFLFAVILFAYAIKYPKNVKRFLIYLNEKFSRFYKDKTKKNKLVDWINQEVDNFHCSFMIFLKEKRKTFFAASILTVFYWFVVWLIPSMILMGLGLYHFIIPSFAAQVFLIIIIMMPTTPGAAGVTEGSVAILYSVIIGEPNLHLLGVFVILFRFITYHMNLIVGAFFQHRIFKSVASFSMDMIKKNDNKS